MKSRRTIIVVILLVAIAVTLTVGIICTRARTLSLLKTKRKSLAL